MTDLEIVSDFDLVWQAYPRKVGKGAARKVWAKLRPSSETVQQMLDALVWQVTQPQWIKDGGQFIPHLATWLNQERWEDEPFNLPNLNDKSVRRLQNAMAAGSQRLLH